MTPKHCRPLRAAAPSAVAAVAAHAPAASAATVIELRGELDIGTTPALRERLLEALRTSTALLVLDLSGVRFCGAAGLAVFVAIERHARHLGITVRLAAPSPQVRRMLRITGLDRRLTIDQSVWTTTPLQRPHPVARLKGRRV